jgi:hypothetical protein
VVSSADSGETRANHEHIEMFNLHLVYRRAYVRMENSCEAAVDKRSIGRRVI